MKMRRQVLSFIIVFLLVFNFYIFGTNTATSSIEPYPDQFIAEIFPNCTLPLQLTHTNTIINFDATEFSKKLSIDFDANYTIYNPENTTTIPLMIPFSLGIDSTKFTYEVFANNSPILYDLFSTTKWNENMTAVDIYWLPSWIDITEYYNNPITFIRTNITLLKNSTSVIRYRFNGSMNVVYNPVYNVFYIAYYIGTSKAWKGDTSGSVNLTVYGTQPVFASGVVNVSGTSSSITDVDGGSSLLYKWYKSYNPWGDIGIRYYRASPFEVIKEIMLFLIPFLVIAIVIIALFLRKRRK